LFREGQRNVVAFRQVLQGIAKGEVLMFHHETEDISPLPAAKAVEELVFRIHMKGWGLFLMKGAKPNISITNPPQRHKLTHHINNINSLLD
jgi:hypothetical protein